MSANDFQSVQKAFCAHLRDPDKHPAPDAIEDRRMEVYRGLFFRNMVGTFRDFFPVTAALYTDENLEQLVRSFYAHHQSHTPYFHYLGQEFVDYLTDEHTPTDADPPYLAELADYEWHSMSVRLHDAGTVEETTAFDAVDDPLAYPLVLTPNRVLRTYAYPVHKVHAETLPAEPPAVPTFLLIFRTGTKTRFMELNAATARLVQLLDDSTVPARTHIQTVADELPQVATEAVFAGGREAVAELFRRGAICGCRT